MTSKPKDKKDVIFYDGIDCDCPLCRAGVVRNRLQTVEFKDGSKGYVRMPEGLHLRIMLELGL